MSLKNRFLTGSIITGILLLSGCGDSESKYIKAPQPHEVDISGEPDNGQTDADNWHKFVTFRAQYTQENDQFCVTVCSPKGISDDVAHFQIYIDADMDKSTGFTDTFQTDFYTLTGIDYMIEDGILFVSESQTEWKWKAVDAYSFQKIQDQNGSYTVHTWGSIQTIAPLADVQDGQQIEVSMEPVDSLWQDTHNFVMPQTVNINVQ